MALRFWKERDLIKVFREDCEEAVTEFGFEKKCYWIALFDENFNKFWWLFRKDCDCPCECEDPIRLGLEFPEPFFDVCPSQVYIPEHLYAAWRYKEEVEDEEGNKKKIERIVLKDINYRETKCVFPIQDCWIELGTPFWEEFFDEGIPVAHYCYPLNVRMVYNPNTICVNGVCTGNYRFRCLERLDVLYGIPWAVCEEDLPALLSMMEEGRIPCNINYEYVGHCRFNPNYLHFYLAGLEPLIGTQITYSHSDPRTEWYIWDGITINLDFRWGQITTTTSYSIYTTTTSTTTTPTITTTTTTTTTTPWIPWRPGSPGSPWDVVERYIRAYIETKQEIPKYCESFPSTADCFILANLVAVPQVPLYYPSHSLRIENPLYEFPGICLIYFLPEGIQYWYHTCKQFYRCPQIEYDFESPDCPYRVYEIGIFLCEPEFPLETRFPRMCPLPPCASAYAPPAARKRQYFEVIDNPEGGIRVAGEDVEVVHGNPYDLVVRWKRTDNLITIVDPISHVHSGYGRPVPACTFWVFFHNNERGELGLVHAYTTCLHLGEFKEFLDEAYEQHQNNCENRAGCYTELSRFFDLDYNDVRKGLAPILGRWYGSNYEPDFFMRRFGFILLAEDMTVYPILQIFGIDFEVFDSIPNKVCILEYSDGDWSVDGNCSDCSYYQKKLRAMLQGCLRGPMRTPYDFAWRNPHHGAGRYVYPADPKSCWCTIGDLFNFLSQFYTIRYILTCPGDHVPQTDEYCWHVTDCGPYLVPEIMFCPGHAITTTSYGELICCPCTTVDFYCPDYDILLDERVKMAWVFFPYFYHPCVVVKRTTTTSFIEELFEEIELEPARDEDLFNPPCKKELDDKG